MFVDKCDWQKGSAGHQASDRSCFAGEDIYIPNGGFVFKDTSFRHSAVCLGCAYRQYISVISSESLARARVLVLVLRRILRSVYNIESLSPMIRSSLLLLCRYSPHCFSGFWYGFVYISPTTLSEESFVLSIMNLEARNTKRFSSSQISKSSHRVQAPSFR